MGYSTNQTHYHILSPTEDRHHQPVHLILIPTRLHKRFRNHETGGSLLRGVRKQLRLTTTLLPTPYTSHNFDHTNYSQRLFIKKSTAFRPSHNFNEPRSTRRFTSHRPCLPLSKRNRFKLFQTKTSDLNNTLGRCLYLKRLKYRRDGRSKRTCPKLDQAVKTVWVEESRLHVSI